MRVSPGPLEISAEIVCAQIVVLDARPGDVVVMATDGLYDNIFDDEIVQIVARTLRERLVGGAPKPAAQPARGNGAGLTAGGLGQLGTSATSTAGRLRLRLQRPGGYSAPHHNHHSNGSHGRGAPPTPLSQLVTAAAAKGALSEKDARAVAGALTRTAHAYACNPCRRTPWSVAASGAGATWSRQFAAGGGKMDDVTVVVAFVVGDGQA